MRKYSHNNSFIFVQIHASLPSTPLSRSYAMMDIKQLNIVITICPYTGHRPTRKASHTSCSIYPWIRVPSSLRSKTPSKHTFHLPSIYRPSISTRRVSAVRHLTPLITVSNITRRVPILQCATAMSASKHHHRHKRSMTLTISWGASARSSKI